MDGKSRRHQPRTKARVPFSLVLLTVVLLLVTSLAAVVGFVGWSALRQLEIEAISQQFAGLSNRVATGLGERLRSITLIQQQLASDPAFREPARDTEAIAEAGWRLASGARPFNAINALYFGYADGGFILGTLLHRMDSRNVRALNPPRGATVLVRHIKPSEVGRSQTFLFLAGPDEIIEERVVDSTYDPRMRPWYTLAGATTEPLLTPPYLYSDQQQLGISLVQTTPSGRGVVGGDMLLRNMAGLALASQIAASGKFVMFLEDGTLLAHPDQDVLITGAGSDPSNLRVGSLTNTDRPLLAAIHEQYLAGTLGETQIVAADGESFIVRVDLLDAPVANPIYVASAVPLDAISSRSRELVSQTAIAAVVAVVLSVIATLVMSQLLSAPIRRLVGATEKIRNLDFSTDAAIDSRIHEVGALSDSLERMRHGLDLFGRYVPRKLVHRVVEHPDTARIGGERRAVSVMFTDIENYTTISEAQSPERLMQATSAYFTHLGQAITECRGVIDKYIGDSVMAFWNAPDDEPDHAAWACRAALAVDAATTAYNREAETNGWPAFRTRIGLHTGEGIVGNVGSSDRMNYTLVGSVVNMASRLEGLNKRYGTTIIASRDVRTAAGDRFLFRKMDRVIPAGAATPIEVYELLAFAEELTEQKHAKLIEATRAWDAGMSAYFAGSFEETHQLMGAFCTDHPTDRPARRFQDRLDTLRRSPPPTDWTGITVLDQK